VLAFSKTPPLTLDTQLKRGRRTGKFVTRTIRHPDGTRPFRPLGMMLSLLV
jgi:hypothetical protein